MHSAMLMDDALIFYRALQRHDWPTYFDRNTLKRGKRYAEQGFVSGPISLEHEDNSLALAGQVEGSLKRPYRTEIEITIDPHEPDMLAICTCPVGVGCKHAVALIEIFLHYLDEKGWTAAMAGSPQPEAEVSTPRNDDTLARLQWESWIRQMEEVPPVAPEHQRVGHEYRLGLLLDVGMGRFFSSVPKLAVMPVWLRPSRQRGRGSGWVAPRRIEFASDGQLQPSPEDGWTATAEEAVDRLLHGEAGHMHARNQGQWRLVSTDLQARALWRLLESDTPPLLFYQQQTGPLLQFGDPCQLVSDWQTDDQGVQRLVPLTEPADSVSEDAVFASVGRDLCYLDPTYEYLGHLEGTPERLAHVYRAPPLPPGISEWLDDQFQQSDALARTLPTPHRVEEQVLADVSPQLKATMTIAMGQVGTHRGILLSPQRDALPYWVHVGAAIIQFNYAGIDVAPEEGDTATGYRDGKQLTVQRDGNKEVALIQSLPSGMVPLEQLYKNDAFPDYLNLPGWTLLLPIDGTPPTSAEEWSTHLAAPDEWWDMIDQLREAGCRIEFDPDFPEEPVVVSPDAWHGELEPAGNGWFDLALDIEVEGERLNLLPILRQLLQRSDFPLEPEENEPEDATWTLALPDNRQLELPLTRLRSLMAPILDWLDDRDDPGAAVPLPVTAAEQMAPLAENERWAGREHMTDLADRLRQLPTTVEEPPDFAGELRDYQARGVAWMRFLAELDTGGILADDMGLGKTIQVLAHILDERARGTLTAPVLVVAPTSLVGNWWSETAHFAPELTVVALQSGKAKRMRQFDEALADADLVITTYALINRDLERLQETHFGLLVLDEAQAIKNAASQSARAVRQLNAERTLAMTGTPLENHLGELWAQLDVVAPGALGSQQWFGRHFRTPIEKDGDVTLRERLTRRISPLMLRRGKQQVLAELPDITEQRHDITLSGAQRELYESLRLAQHQRVQQAIAERGLAGSGIVMLDALLKLRQVCCDPRLVKLDSARKVQQSAKLQRLRELVSPLVEEGRHILIFSQFTEMLTLIGEALEKDGIAFTTLTGETPGKARTARVASFQQGDIPVFLISLKAGGTGLNLTAADTVIHYDPWWNPAVEAQATGRAHRMGQKNPVFVHKLVCAGSVEERILDLQSRKADLAASILEGGEERQNGGVLFDEDDLALLFAPVA
ncbi:hypothetical protein GCM10022228_07690 [Halomonas cibimaris]|uniref:Helicase SNF2 n=1 Tax=Halomonas cibimaris TaxID=657012 RepID=A0ABP7LHD2_9GAMM